MHKFYTSNTGYADVEFRNNGVLTDPDQDATFYVEMYDADDVLQATYTLSTTPAITAISTGAFKIQDFALAAYAEGIPYAKWYAKISGVAIEPYPYIDYWGQILEDPTGYNLCSLDDLKMHLEIESDSQNTFLGKLVLRATQFIETYCNRQLASREFTEYYSGDGTNSIMLPNTPITAVTQIKDDKSGQADFDYDDTDENDAFSFEEWGKLLLTNGDVFREPSSTYPLRNYKIVYTGGYATAPEDLRQVCIELAAAKFYLKDKQRQGIASKSVAGQTISYRPDDLSPAQKEVLEAYRTIVTGAV